jgi:hypothetical protein
LHLVSDNGKIPEEIPVRLDLLSIALLYCGKWLVTRKKAGPSGILRHRSSSLSRVNLQQQGRSVTDLCTIQGVSDGSKKDADYK